MEFLLGGKEIIISTPMSFGTARLCYYRLQKAEKVLRMVPGGSSQQASLASTVLINSGLNSAYTNKSHVIASLLKAGCGSTHPTTQHAKAKAGESGLERGGK